MTRLILLAAGLVLGYTTAPTAGVSDLLMPFDDDEPEDKP